MFEGYGPASWLIFAAAIMSRAMLARLSPVAHMARTVARPTSALPIRRALSLRKASALEPQRLSRRRFPLSTPFGVTGPMKARSRLAVRNLLQILPRDDRLTTTETGGGRIGDETIADPRVNPLALATDGGGIRFRHNRQSFRRR